MPRHHLRHQQRVRLRLSARQHEVPLEDMVQRGHFNFAIVDEVDSILIDEARTPLIISGPTEDRSELYRVDRRADPAAEAPSTSRRTRSSAPSPSPKRQRAIEACCASVGLLKGAALRHRERLAGPPRQPGAARPQAVPARQVDYIVKDDKVVIIDEFTGRMMEGRRYPKACTRRSRPRKACQVQPENQTLASITFQNYFRLYPSWPA
jgi:preprotein translocase subunit SecA